MASTIIGITGGIGAGKSVVSRVLRNSGYEVFDCDYEAKRLMVLNPGVRKSLIELCGEEIYTERGEIDRKRLAFLIFSDEELRIKVNSIVHSEVRKAFSERAAETKDIFFVEAAIMASSGLAGYCNEIWYISAPEELRRERALRRGGITNEDLEKRIASQKFESKKLSQFGVKIKILENLPDSSLLSAIQSALHTC